jgi:hypothetical protein
MAYFVFLAWVFTPYSWFEFGIVFSVGVVAALIGTRPRKTAA